ncbi:MAG: hypothetical protein ABGX32_00190 [Methylococcales bacterium]
MKGWRNSTWHRSPAGSFASHDQSSLSPSFSSRSCLGKGFEPATTGVPSGPAKALPGEVTTGTEALASGGSIPPIATS